MVLRLRERGIEPPGTAGHIDHTRWDLDPQSRLGMQFKCGGQGVFETRMVDIILHRAGLSGPGSPWKALAAARIQVRWVGPTARQPGSDAEENAKENAEEVHKEAEPSTSRHSGVSWHKAAKQWWAQVWHGGKKHHLGSFATEDEAKACHDARCLELGRDPDVGRTPRRGASGFRGVEPEEPEAAEKEAEKEAAEKEAEKEVQKEAEPEEAEKTRQRPTKKRRGAGR